jgi:DMSO reductase anchor subunit
MGGLIAHARALSRRGLRRAGVFLLAVLGTLTMLAVVTLPALAQEKVPDFEISQEKAPELDYTLSAGTAILTFGLLIVFLVMLFVLSEREFKGVINERFGPKK